MFVVCYGNIVDGMSFVGPFISHDDAVLHCDGDDSQWNIIELDAPPDGAAGSLWAHLQDVED